MDILSALFYGFIALQVADILTTLKFLDQKSAVEANPIMAKLFAIAGPGPALLVTKALVISGAYWMMIQPQYAATFTPVLALVDAIYVGVIVNNLKFILGHKK